MNNRSARIVAIVFGLSLCGFGGCTMPAAQSRPGFDSAAPSNSPSSAPYNVKSDPEPLSNPGLIAYASAQVQPSVVTINTEYQPRMAYSDNPFGQEAAVQPRGTGSGVILSADGIIVTNNHVVEKATKIQVTLQDGRELEGRVVGADPPSDLAVVRVDEKNLPAVTLGDSDKVRVGEWVVAVGNPLGVGTTVTAGIISALHKKDAPTNGRIPLTGAIQTDAAINPGNSGGALADTKGRLIGINTAILSPSGGSIGLGFAIPVNTVRDITRQLVEKGQVVRPWLGIAFGSITDRARSALNLPADLNGVIVGAVVSGSPAETAGLQPGDVLQQVNDTKITRAEDLQNLMQGMKVGDRLGLSFARRGRSITGTAILREQPKRTSPGPRE